MGTASHLTPGYTSVGDEKKSCSTKQPAPRAQFIKALLSSTINFKFSPKREKICCSMRVFIDFNNGSIWYPSPFVMIIQVGLKRFTSVASPTPRYAPVTENVS